MQSTFHNTVESKKRKTALARKASLYSTRLHTIVSKHDITKHESALFIAGDTKYQKNITKVLKPFMGVKQVVLIGIGGSDLGTQAVYQALSFKTGAQLLVLDSVEQESLRKFSFFIDQTEKLSDIAIVVVSKSGGTTETMLNAGKVLALCEERFGDVCHSRFIFVGDQGTPFWKVGKKKKILCVQIPEAIGGRYSIFTAVGMVPLTLLGIDVESLREGAMSILKKESLKHIEECAVDLAVAAESGVHTVNFFTFNDRLRYCGYWYRQLLAESIGKNMTRHKTTFSHQLLPIVSTSVDLHSMAQLFLGGYKHIYTHFVTFSEESSYHLPASHWLTAHVSFLAGKDARDVKEAITKGVLQSYDDQKLMYRYTRLPKLSAFELGAFMTSLMYEVMCLGYLLDVDPFDQPSVELYKKHTRTHLG